MEYISNGMMVGPLTDGDKIILSRAHVPRDSLFPISMLVGPLSEKEKSRCSKNFCVTPIAQDTFHITNRGGKAPANKQATTEDLQKSTPAPIKSCRAPTSRTLPATIKSCSAPTSRTLPAPKSGTGFLRREGGTIESGAEGECAFHYGSLPYVIVRNGTRSEAWFHVPQSGRRDRNGTRSETWVRVPEGGLPARTTQRKAKKSFFSLKKFNCFTHRDYTVYA